MLETSARLLGLLTLLQGSREWSGADLARRLEVDVRTVRRDVEKLRMLGYVIHASPGLGGGYRMGAGNSLPPLLLGDDEAVAVAAALSVAINGIDKLEETALGVLVKLDQLLPARLRKRVSALSDVTVSLGSGMARIDSDLLTRVAAACRERELLEFEYGGRDGQLVERTVEPLKLAHTGRRWYLVAWDRQRADWRTFRLDRLKGQPRVIGHFEARTPPGDIEAFVSRAISHSPYRHQVRLRLAGSRSQLIDSIPPWCGNLEHVDERSCELRTGAETIDAVIGQIVLAGTEFELLEPLELRERLLASVERLARGLGAGARFEINPPAAG
jgi:predicted DNA-binding transcriptional regulator YafY